MYLFMLSIHSFDYGTSTKQNGWFLIHIDHMSAKYQNATVMPIECALGMIGSDGLLHVSMPTAVS